MRSADDLIEPWFHHIVREVGGVDLHDAHAHIGSNDPDGFSQTPEQLLDHLRAADARSVVFPMQEPEGYGAANDAVLEAAAGSNGRLTAFCRVDPHRDALAEARRCFAAGARGIKLHPRAEQFVMSAGAVRDLVAFAHEHRAPVLVHAGRGIPALGRDTVRLADEFPDARLILAHAAISDLAWLHRVLPAHRNVFIDTAWWNPFDLLALFALCPPGQILFASDSPYGTPVQAAVVAFRCALQAGLDAERTRLVAGAQLDRILAGEDPLDAGPAPGQGGLTGDVLLVRIAGHLSNAMARRVIGGDGDEPVALARLACAVGEDADQAAVCASVLELIERGERFRELPPAERLPLGDMHALACAMTVALTPSVPLPHVAGEPHPVREDLPV